MNITLERTESSKIKYELEKAIQFNELLLKDISYPSFLFNILGRYEGIHLITLDHIITKYEKERKITILQRRTIGKIDKVHLRMVVFNFEGMDYSIIKQWIAETEGELVELINKYHTIVEKR